MPNAYATAPGFIGQVPSAYGGMDGRVKVVRAGTVVCLSSVPAASAGRLPIVYSSASSVAALTSVPAASTSAPGAGGVYAVGAVPVGGTNGLAALFSSAGYKTDAFVRTASVAGVSVFGGSGFQSAAATSGKNGVVAWIQAYHDPLGTVPAQSSRLTGQSALSGTGFTQTSSADPVNDGFIAGIVVSGSKTDAFVGTASLGGVSVLGGSAFTTAITGRGADGLLASTLAIGMAGPPSKVGTGLLRGLAAMFGSGEHSTKIVGGTAGMFFQQLMSRLQQVAAPVYGTGAVDGSATFVPTIQVAHTFVTVTLDAGPGVVSAVGYSFVTYVGAPISLSGAATQEVVGEEITQFAPPAQMDGSSSLSVVGAGIAVVFADPTAIDAAGSVVAAASQTITAMHPDEQQGVGTLVASGGLALYVLEQPIHLSGAAFCGPSGNQTIQALFAKIGGSAALVLEGLYPALVQGTASLSGSGTARASGTQNATQLKANLFGGAFWQAIGDIALRSGTASLSGAAAVTNAAPAVVPYFFGSSAPQGVAAMSGEGMEALLDGDAVLLASANMGGAGVQRDVALQARLHQDFFLRATIEVVLEFGIDARSHLLGTQVVAGRVITEPPSFPRIFATSSLSAQAVSTTSYLQGQSGVVGTQVGSGGKSDAFVSSVTLSGAAQMEGTGRAFQLTIGGGGGIVTDIAGLAVDVITHQAAALIKQVSALDVLGFAGEVYALEGQGDLSAEVQAKGRPLFGTTYKAFARGLSDLRCDAFATSFLAYGTSRLVTDQLNAARQIVGDVLGEALTIVFSQLEALGVSDSTVMEGLQSTLTGTLTSIGGVEKFSGTQLVTTAELHVTGTRELSGLVQLKAETTLHTIGTFEANRSELISETFLSVTPTIERATVLRAESFLNPVARAYTGKPRVFVRGAWVPLEARWYNPASLELTTGLGDGWEPATLRVYDNGEWRKVR